MTKCSNFLGRLIRERRCVVCHEPFAPPPGVARDDPAGLACAACLAGLPARRAGFCPLCGEIAPWPLLPVLPCGKCLQQPPPWSAFFFYAPYDGLLRKLLIRLKFGNEPGLGRFLGLLALRGPLRERDHDAHDAVVPVPLSDQRLGRRGYNQALEPARALAGKALPLRPDLLRRVKHGAPQTGLSHAERQSNLKDAFVGSPAAAGLRLLLVDDVATTGATLEAAALALLRAGAAETAVAVCARTPRRRNT